MLTVRSKDLTSMRKAEQELEGVRHKELNEVVDTLYEMFHKEHNLKRNFEKYKHHIRTFVMDLFVCHQQEVDGSEVATYITYSRNQSDYAIHTGRLKRGRPKKVAGL